MTLTQNDFDDFFKYFKPEPNIEYSVIVSDWHKFVDTFKGKPEPRIGFKVYVINGEVLNNPKEWNTGAVSLLAPLMPFILTAQKQGMNSLQFRFMRKNDKTFTVINDSIQVVNRHVPRARYD